MGKNKKAKYDMTPYNDYLNYLKNYDTSKVDGTIKNFEDMALTLSGNLANRPDYVYSVDGSDEARRRAEQATYQSYTDKLNPAFERQSSDLAASLANKGLSVGSEAYSRAMSDLHDSQNDALNQAAYQSVLAGQNSFSNSLADAINAGNYQNTARNLPINEILALLSNSVSGYDNQQNIFSVGTGKSDVKYQQDKANAKGGWTGAINGAIKGAAAGSALGPYGMAAGAAAGGYAGYNS